MEYINKQLKKGEYVNRWLRTNLFETHKSFTPEIDYNEGQVNDWLIHGPQIHEFPGRREYIKDRKSNTHIPPKLLNAYAEKKIEEKNVEWQLYTPFEKKEVAFEGFWPEPTILHAWAYNEIISSESTITSFELAASGGIEIWVNEKKVYEMAPFTRNELYYELIKVPLEEGVNRCYIYFDDLAERDTQFAFQMKYLSEEKLVLQLPVGEQNKEKIEHVEQLLQSAFLPYDCYKNGFVSLKFDQIAKYDLKVDTTFKVERCDLQSKSYILRKGSAEITFGSVNDFQMGFQKITVIIHVNNIKMSRVFTVQLVPEKYLELSKVPKDTNQRKKCSLELVSAIGESNVHRVLARLFQGNNDSVTNQMLLEDVETVKNKIDCSDFSIVMYYKLLKMNEENNLLSEKTKEEIKNSILNYRYWHDEPGNDVMWFYSENHALMFHTSELLMGQLYAQERFWNADITGKEHYDKAYDRLVDWFERFFKEGFSEWHSSAYIPINVIGLLQIYDHSEDRTLKNLAAEALELIFYWLEKNSYKGYLTCSQGRVYEKELKGHYNTQTTHLMWIANNEGNINYSGIGSVALALSTFTPKQMNKDLNNYYTFENNQGSALEAHVYTHRIEGGMLSSVLSYRAGSQGYQEHVVQASFGPEENVWINHPGEELKRGNKRPSYWAGNGCLPNVLQYKGFSVITFNITGKLDLPYTHAYAPLHLFDEYEIGSHCLFLKKGNSWLALFAENGISLVEKGMDAYREVISNGKDNTWIIRLGNKAEYKSFEEFKIQIKKAIYNADLTNFSFYDPIYGRMKITKNFLTIEEKAQTYSTKGVKGIISYP